MAKGNYIQLQQPLSFNNPYLLKTYLDGNGIKYRETTSPIGKGKDRGYGNIDHIVKALGVTLPGGAHNVNVYQFITNIDGLAGAGYNLKTDPWCNQAEVDIRWGIMHQYVLMQDAQGIISVSVTYDNWSDQDTRDGYLIVTYEE